VKILLFFLAVLLGMLILSKHDGLVRTSWGQTIPLGTYEVPVPPPAPPPVFLPPPVTYGPTVPFYPPVEPAPSITIEGAPGIWSTVPSE
jgi:hypothetical protein